MDRSQYYREQADLCLQLARATPSSDMKDALIALVGEYLARAGQEPPAPAAPKVQSPS